MAVTLPVYAAFGLGFSRDTAELWGSSAFKGKDPSQHAWDQIQPRLRNKRRETSTKPRSEAQPA